MTITRALAHNTIVQFGGKIISTLLGLAALGLMTRALSLEQVGWYGTATGFLQFVGIVVDFGFTVTISNLLAEPTFSQRAVLNTMFTWRLITALAIHALTLGAFWFFPYPAPIKIAASVLTISFLAVALNSIFIGWYRTALKMLAATVSEILGRVALVIGIALAAVSQFGFIAMMSAVSAASVLSVLYLYLKIGGIRLALDKKISRVMFNKMWPTAIAVMFNAVYLQGDRVILPLFVPQATVGLYAVSYRILDVVLQVSAMSMGLVMPMITFAWSRGLKTEFRERYQLALDLLALLLLPMSVGIYVLAGPVMRLVGGAEFGGAAYILKGLSVSIAGTTLGMVFGHVALAINRQKQALWVYASDAILSLIGYFIFIPRFGVNGAIGVTIFSEWYAGFLLMAITIYYAQLAPRFYTFAKIVVASLLMGGAVAFVPLPHVIWSILFGAIVFGFLTLLFKIISWGTLKEVLGRSAIAEAEPTVLQ